MHVASHDLNKLAAEKWRPMSDEDKKKYTDMAKQDSAPRDGLPTPRPPQGDPTDRGSYDWEYDVRERV